MRSEVLRLRLRAIKMVLHCVPSRCKTIYPEPDSRRLPCPPGNAVGFVSAAPRLFLEPILPVRQSLMGGGVCNVNRAKGQGTFARFFSSMVCGRAVSAPRRLRSIARAVAIPCR
jgi:hypothetical protein